MKTTTQRVYIKNMDTINEWIKRLELKSFAELIDNWIDAVTLQKRQEFYSKLCPIVIKPHKPLSGVKIQKMYTK